MRTTLNLNNDLLAQAYQNAGTYNGVGELDLTLVGGKPVPTGDADAQKALRRYVGLLDTLRQVGRILGGGPLGGGGGGGDD